MKKLAITSSIAAAILALVGAGHAQVPPVPTVPDGLPTAVRGPLLEQRATLVHELSDLQSKAGAFNAECARVPTGSPAAQVCAQEQSQLVGQKRTYIDGVKELEARLRKLATITNCKQHARLASEWNSRKSRISVDQQIVSNLGANFKRHAAKLQALGANLSETRQDLDRIDRALDQLSSHKAAIEANDALDDVSEAELEEYKLIAQGMKAWTADIIKVVAALKINQQTEAEIAGLKEMQSREHQLVNDVAALEQVKQQLAAVGPCDSTSLVE